MYIFMFNVCSFSCFEDLVLCAAASFIISLLVQQFSSTRSTMWRACRKVSCFLIPVSLQSPCVKSITLSQTETSLYLDAFCRMISSVITPQLLQQEIRFVVDQSTRVENLRVNIIGKKLVCLLLTPFFSPHFRKEAVFCLCFFLFLRTKCFLFLWVWIL